MTVSKDNFTILNTLVEGLNAGGGTNIASGMSQAMKIMR